MYFPPKSERTFEPGDPSLEDRFRALFLGEHFSAIASLPPENCALAFEELKENGIDIGDGGFAVALFLTPSAYDPSMEGYQELTTAIEETFETHIRYFMFSSKGKLQLLLSFPDFQEENRAQTAALIRELIERVAQDSRFRQIGTAAIVSSIHCGTENIHRATDEAESRYSLHRFLKNPPTLFFIQSGSDGPEQFARCMEIYQRFSNQVIAAVQEYSFSPEEAAALLGTCVENACTDSTIPILTHMSVLVMTLTRTMIDAGIADADFARDAVKQYDLFMNKNEVQLLEAASVYFAQIRAQYLIVSKNIVAERIRKIKDYIEENISHYDLSVTSISDEFHVNRSLLTLQFKKFYEVSLSQYMQTCRVEKAKALMNEHSDWSMERVAECAGYNSLSTMYRAFKKLDGVAPANFRQMGKKSAE